MNHEITPVTVHILEKEYHVACAKHEQEVLFEAALYMNNRMEEIRDTGKVVGTERIAVMAALNIAHELLQQRARTEDHPQIAKGSLYALQEKVDAALRRNKQL